LPSLPGFLALAAPFAGTSFGLKRAPGYAQITRQQATQLPMSSDAASLVGLRDLPAIGLLIFTGARAGAIVKLCLSLQP
jgi:hypothetical protein